MLSIDEPSQEHSKIIRMLHFKGIWHDGQYSSVKGEREKEKGFKYIQLPLPLNFFPDHKGSSYCLSKPYWQDDRKQSREKTIYLNELVNLFFGSPLLCLFRILIAD
jgi:hypothetical protein